MSAAPKSCEYKEYQQYRTQKYLEQNDSWQYLQYRISKYSEYEKYPEEAHEAQILRVHELPEVFHLEYSLLYSQVLGVCVCMCEECYLLSFYALLGTALVRLVSYMYEHEVFSFYT